MLEYIPNEYGRGYVSSRFAARTGVHVPLAFIDICDGNMHDAILFSQIMYWHEPSHETGKPRMQRPKDGHLWVAKNHGDWFAECRIKAATVRNCLTRLKEVGLIFYELHGEKGQKTPYIRINWDVFEAKMKSLTPLSSQDIPLSSQDESNTETTQRDKDKSTPLPPGGGMGTEAQAPKATAPNKPTESTELVAMKYAVCQHLKAHGKPGKQVAKLLLNLHKGKAAEYNVGGVAFTPDDVERFGIWWDKGHWDPKARKPLTRPRNMGSVQSYFLMWRAEIAEKKRIDNEPELVYEPIEPLDPAAPNIFDIQRDEVAS